MLLHAARQATGIVRAWSHERLSPEQIRSYQTQRLRWMVQHAWDNSPFYRRKLSDVGVTPADIQSLDDLSKLPITTKEEIRHLPSAELLARGYTPQNTVFEPTSGSSGKVLHIYHSRGAYDMYFAYAFRHLWQLGYRPWYRVAYTAFDPLPSLPWERIGLGQRQQIDLKLKDARAFLQRLLEINPQFITAYPSILLMIIQVATEAELRRIRPRAIHLHSELLTDGIRDTIRMAFDCDCFDDYSTFEFHHVAYECPAHRYHIAADNVLVEFLRDGKPAAPGEDGDLIITGLTNPAMPLLRYAIGDVGRVGQVERCACGSGFPTMGLIQGRVDDFIILPSGRRFSPRIVNPAFESMPGLLEHVLVQEELDHIKLYLNVLPEHVETLPGTIVATLRDLFAEPVKLDVVLTQDFERGRTGKLRCIVSKVKQSSVVDNAARAYQLSSAEVI